MARCDKDAKQAIAQDYPAGPDRFRARAPKHETDPSTIHQWVDVYRQHGGAGLHRKARDMLQALNRMWREELTTNPRRCKRYAKKTRT